MKKTLLAMLAIAGLIGGTLYLTPTEANAAVAPVVVDSPCGPNPYDSYSVPLLALPVCPDGQVLNNTCVHDTRSAFADAVGAANSTAKHAWNVACGTRTAAFKKIQASFDSCDYPANPLCLEHYNDDNLEAQRTFIDTTSSIASTFASTVNGLKSAYQQMMEDCCEDEE
jgi:hypothetical protein